MHAFGATRDAAAAAVPTLIRPASRPASGTTSAQECARLADLLVYQVGADPSHLRPPSETFSPYGQERMIAGLYVVTPSSAWRQEFRSALDKLVAQGGAQQGSALITCLLPKLVEITDQTSQNIAAHLNSELTAITGVAPRPTLSMAPRPITGSATAAPPSYTGRPSAPSAETEQPITSAPPTDVYLPPTETPPGPPPMPAPPGSKEFPWVPVVIGVGVVGGIGLLLLAKKKKRK